MEVDDTDKWILYLLQQDARQLTTQEMAVNVGVSAGTVRNRIERLEENGIIRGFDPDIDSDSAGLQLSVEVICSAQDPEREAMVQEAPDVAGVVPRCDVLAGKENVQIDAVGAESDDIARITDQLCDVGSAVVNTKTIRETYTQSFDHFGQHLVEDATFEQ